MNEPYELPEYQFLLAAVRAAPDDDLPRLVLADWLEERGEGERAEFIRLQVEYRRAKTKTQRTIHRRAIKQFMRGGVTLRKYPWFNHVLDGCDFGFSVDGWHCVVGDFSNRGSVDYCRGFITRVSGPLVSLIGGECGCARTPNRLDGDCTSCGNTGSTPGVLRELVKREPVGFVEVTDREPWSVAGGAGRWGWSKHPDDMMFPGNRSVIPAEILDLIPEAEDAPIRGFRHRRWFRTADAARAALSAAILRHATTPIDSHPEATAGISDEFGRAVHRMHSRD